METWIKTAPTTNWQRGILGKGSNDVNAVDSYGLYFSSGSGNSSSLGSLRSTDENFVDVVGNTVINDNNWHHLVVTAPSTGNVSIYIDGVQNATFNNSHPLLATISDHLLIGGAGKASGSSFTMTGSLDEVRISNSPRSADWIATEYNNQSSLSTFYALGQENGPSIAALNPSSGERGASITIAGTGFTSTTGSVSFNGQTATIVSWSSTSIVAIVPYGATTGPVIVTAGGIQTNGVGFTVLMPTIASLSVNAGNPGTTVAIVGANFDSAQGAGGVTFGGLAAPIVSWGPTIISALVPNGAVTGNVVVTAPNGVASNGLPFTVTDDFAITFFSPASGPVGTVVTITGGGFGGSQGSVAFSGVAATVNSWSDTQIVATVAPLTESGPITVSSSYTSAALGGAWVSLSSTGSGCSSCTVRGTLSNTFDSNGNVLSSTDELGHVTSFTYDAGNNMASQSGQLDSSTTVTTSFTYNSFGEPLIVTDPLGNVTTNTYDANGNLKTVVSPKPDALTDNSVTQFDYDPKGQLTQITDPLHHITTLTYYPTGLINTIKDAQQNITTYEYDLRGNRTAVVDALTNRTEFQYDLGNRLKKIIYPDTTTFVTFEYDSRGRRKSVTDQNGKITTYTYDDADRLTDVKDAANNITHYEYDTENNLLSITDAATHSTAFEYDAFGRVKKTTFPSTLQESYIYDAVGNLVSKTDRNNHSILYVYDALNRLTHKGYPDSTGVDYFYDLAGKIKQVTDPTGTYGMAYDNMGRLLGTTTQYSFLPGHTYSNSYAYDAGSNRAGFTAPDGTTNTYVYDTLNRLANLTDSQTGQFTFSYDALSRRTQLARPNGITSSYAYDPVSHLQSILHKLGVNAVDGATYSYDFAGNRTSKTNALNSTASNFAYDNIYQLTGVSGAVSESYTFDPVGNRLTSASVPNYSYNSSNELTGSGSATYTYDNNGNIVTKTSPARGLQLTLGILRIG